MDPLTLGGFIKTCRTEKGMTQRELALRLNVTDKAISRWERGVGFPDIQLLKPLAEALGVSAAELIQCQRAEKSQTIPESVHSKTTACWIFRRPIALTWFCVFLLGLHSLLQRFLPFITGYACPSFLRNGVFLLLILGVLALSYFYKGKQYE